LRASGAKTNVCAGAQTEWILAPIIATLAARRPDTAQPIAGESWMSSSLQRIAISAGLFALAFSLGHATAVAEAVDFPPLTEGAAPEHLPGKVVWADLVTPNLAGAEAFYTGLFGWSIREIHVGNTDYAVASADGRPIAGLVQRTVRADEQKQSDWLTFIAVKDADAAVRTAASDGAKILSKPTTYRGRGRQAVLAGPDGAVFAVLASRSGDPGDFLAEPGEWIWSALLTEDPDKAAKFYKAVFGYDLFDLPSEDGLQHVVLSSQNYARAGINSLPQDTHHRHPHWLSFIRVKDTPQAVAKAEALGGKVLVEPRVDRHGGRIALLADPYGAPFGVMEWTATDSKTEPDSPTAPK
jgi:predicted enzyme related to lactoylglutathione lyase